jgi:hypothetical protein
VRAEASGRKPHNFISSEVVGNFRFAPDTGHPFANSRLPLWVGLTRSSNRPAMSAFCGLCSLMGQGGRLLLGFDTLGCLCSLRARRRLMG